MTNSIKNTLSEMTKEMDTIRTRIKEINNTKHVNSKLNILKDIEVHFKKCDDKVKLS
jgi:hypothetical protein